MLVVLGSDYKREVTMKVNTLMSHVRIRKYNKLQAKIRQYLYELEGVIEHNKNEGSENTKLLEAHLTEIQTQMNIKREYSENCLGFFYDELYELEKMGLRESARAYQVMFDVEDMLDVVLSEVFYLSREDIRECIERKAKEHGLTYKEVSNAVLGQKTYWEDKVSMDIFIGMHPRIDEHLVKLSQRVDENKVKDVFGNEIDLTEYELDSEQKFSLFFYAMILKYARHLLEHLLLAVNDALRGKYGSEVVLTSFGVSGFLFNSSIPIEGEEFQVGLKFNTFKIKSKCSPMGKYYTKVGEVSCY